MGVQKTCTLLTHKGLMYKNRNGSQLFHSYYSVNQIHVFFDQGSLFKGSDENIIEHHQVTYVLKQSRMHEVGDPTGWVTDLCKSRL